MLPFDLQHILREKSIVNADTGCWEWAASCATPGYGQIWVKEGKSRRLLGAHIASYRAFVGDTKGLCVLHKCDNRICINPAHLFLGTRADNMRDMTEKGRRAVGPRNGQWKHGMRSKYANL